MASSESAFPLFKSASKLGTESKVLNALRFPDISYQEFKELPFTVQKNLIAKNRIVNTDTYNRTMAHLSTSLFKVDEEKGESIGDKTKSTFVLQLRRSPFNYLVAAGIEDMVQELTMLPITQAELDFAKEHYKKHSNLKFFNEKLWQEVIDKHGGKLPFEIHGVKDGTIVFPGEPLFTVKGPEELIAHFEHVFHRVFYSTLVATRAHAITSILGDPSRFIEVGKRGAITEEQHLLALKAAYIGGGINLTSNDAGSIVLPIKDVGTMGHRFVQRFSTEEKAFRHAIDMLDNVTLLVDLVDTYKGIDLAFDLKKEYRPTGKNIAVRLDSGDILDQVRYFLNKSKEYGFTDPALDKVVVEGIDSIDDIVAIEKMIHDEFGDDAKKRVVYGAGGLLISEKTSRSDASSGFKIAEYTDEEGNLNASMKYSNSKGKTSYPGDPILGVLNGKRLVAQSGEKLEVNLFEPLYSFGQILCASEDSLEEGRRRAQRQSTLLQVDASELLNLKAKPSPATQAKIDEVDRKYGKAA